MKRKKLLFTLLVIAATFTGCAKKAPKVSIKTSGSNTLAPVVTSWAENYDAADVSVAGPGSGVGIQDLIDGRCDICNSSRPMKAEEKEKVKAKHGKEVKEFLVGYDALAIFTHLENPIKEISIEQLHNIYIEGASITKWDQLGPGGLTDNIVVLGREKTSGTYEYFHDAVVGKDAAGNKLNFVQSISPQSSSNAIIGQIATVKSAIGYDGMAFNDPKKVKWLAVSKKTGEPSLLPSAEDARSKKYPLSRPLFMYTVGEPDGAIKAFIDYAVSDAGQALLTKVGYVSLR